MRHTDSETCMLTVQELASDKRAPFSQACVSLVDGGLVDYTIGRPTHDASVSWRLREMCSRGVSCTAEPGKQEMHSRKHL
jgi:hypothetical protein